MFALAWLLLPDLPQYRTGLIIVGLARCIAMVLIWNELACGDREAAAVLVAHQLGLPDRRVRRARLVLPAGAARLAGPVDHVSAGFSVGAIAVSVLVFLGIPLVAGFLTRTHRGSGPGPRLVRGHRSCPGSGRWRSTGCCSPSSMLFALQGTPITSRAVGRRPHRAAAARLLRRHVRRSRSASAAACDSATPRPRRWRSPPPATTSSSPSPSRIGTFGVTSGQALAGVVGPAHRGAGPGGAWSTSRCGPPALLPGRPTAPGAVTRSTARDPADRALRLRPQRRPLADGRRLARAPRRRPGRGALGRLEPGDRINPVAVAAMAEVGIDIAGRAARRC